MDTSQTESGTRTTLLRTAGSLLVLVAFAAIVLTALGSADALVEDPTFAAGAVSAALAIGLTMIYAAGDRRRVALVGVPAIALGATATMACTALAIDPRGDESLLIGVAVAAGLLSAILGAMALRSPRAAMAYGGGLDGAEKAAHQELTGPERTARTVLRLMGGVLVLIAALGIVLPFLGSADDFTRRPGLVAAAVGGTICLALLCLAIAADLRARITLIAIPLACSAATVLLQLVQLLRADRERTVELLGAQPSTGLLIAGGLAVALVGAVTQQVLYNRAWRARYGLRFLWPVSHRGLMAMADVLLDPSRRQATPEEIASGVEGFLLGFKAQRRWLYRVALGMLQIGTAIEFAPRPRVNPPLLELEPAQRRRFLADHFQRLPHQRHWRLVKHLRQIMLRIAQQLAYAGYYSKDASYPSIGYEPFTRRERYKDLPITEPGEHPLEVDLPADVDPGELIADVVIVGTGAAGSILAYELAKQGLEVLMLERGDYMQPREFSEREIEMIGRLYSDGLMQQTEDWRFTILQGSCVGGSTTVNNAVCFPPPAAVMERWNAPDGSDAGLDLARLEQSTAAVKAFLNIHTQDEAVLNAGAGPFVEGAKRLGLTDGELEMGVVQANVQGCFGSGYCNMGCRWGKKLSMLDVTLPRAQREFPGKVRIVAECEVVRILTKGADPVEVTGLVAKLGGHREVTVRARKRYVLSAGAVASSYLLLRSGVGAGLPVGERFSANMGAPLVADFPTRQRAYDGLQISHYGRPRNDNYMFETWFNPPVAQALNMPGWFERHFENMLRYDHLSAVGVLVGTASTGKVGRSRLGPTVDFRPRPDELATLARGLRQLGEILFAGGATRVMVNTWGADEYTDPEQLSDLDRVCADPDYIALGTGHPQGGNALSRDRRRGVVGPDFRVHGHSNLYVCDASVFPTSLTVNPQLTVMSLAHYAARSVGEPVAA